MTQEGLTVWEKVEFKVHMKNNDIVKTKNRRGEHVREDLSSKVE